MTANTEESVQYEILTCSILRTLLLAEWHHTDPPVIRSTARAATRGYQNILFHNMVSGCRYGFRRINLVTKPRSPLEMLHTV